MKECGYRHLASIARNDLRFYVRKRRWFALVKALWCVLVLRYCSEKCCDCGWRYHLLWWSPTPLWCELISDTGGGLYCPRCYNKRAERAGIRLFWTPMVVGRYDTGTLIPTTNWWLSDTRDWLMMGEPDPICFDRDRDDEFYPTQWTWEEIKDYFGDRIPPSSNTWGKQERPAKRRGIA